LPGFFAAVYGCVVCAKNWQLRRAVSHANFGKLRFKTEHEQQIWGECARLLTNCIIYYNAMLLSSLLDYKEAAGDVQGAALLIPIRVS
jgi:hypothetical protein